jgi:hypothetical protein
MVVQAAIQEMHMRIRVWAAIAFIAFALRSAPAVAWGDEGHEIIGWVAQAYLDPVARQKVAAMLAADPSSLTAHNIADASTWADKFRDTNENGARGNTGQWHFIDLELDHPDLNSACYGRPGLPPGVLASNGPALDCVVDKIDQFLVELAAPGTDPEERVIALKFVLHLVGDVHQPLHSSDDHDKGGNKKRAGAAGFRSGTLHHYWDTEFVEQLGSSPKQIAAGLVERISPADARAWAQGGPADWAFDSFRVAKDDAYGQLPAPNRRGSYRLPDSYIAMATRDVATQLSKAGVRLAFVLNKALK